MIDYKKYRKEFTELLHTVTADDFQAWLDMDRKRMAELEKKGSSQLNGSTSRMQVQPRAANGRFVSKKITATPKPSTRSTNVLAVSRAQKKTVAV
jgi:hypothetical protein